MKHNANSNPQQSYAKDENALQSPIPSEQLELCALQSTSQSSIIDKLLSSSSSSPSSSSFKKKKKKIGMSKSRGLSSSSSSPVHSPTVHRGDKRRSTRSNSNRSFIGGKGSGQSTVMKSTAVTSSNSWSSNESTCTAMMKSKRRKIQVNENSGNIYKEKDLTRGKGTISLFQNIVPSSSTTFPLIPSESKSNAHDVNITKCGKRKRAQKNQRMKCFEISFQYQSSIDQNQFLSSNQPSCGMDDYLPNYNFVADQIISFTSSSSSSSSSCVNDINGKSDNNYHDPSQTSSQSWPFSLSSTGLSRRIQQTQNRHHGTDNLGKRLTPSQYKQIYQEIQQKANDASSMLLRIREEVTPTAYVQENQHQKKNSFQLSLPTLNFMLQTMNGGLLLQLNNTFQHQHCHQHQQRKPREEQQQQQQQQQPYQHQYWILIPVSITQSKLIPLPFLSGNNRNNTHNIDEENRHCNLNQGNKVVNTNKVHESINATCPQSGGSSILPSTNKYENKNIINDPKEIMIDQEHKLDQLEFNLQKFKSQWSTTIVKNYCHCLVGEVLVEEGKEDVSIRNHENINSSNNNDSNPNTTSMVSFVQNSFRPMFDTIIDLVLSSNATKSPLIHVDHEHKRKDDSVSSNDQKQKDLSTEIMNTLNILLRDSIPLAKILQRENMKSNSAIQNIDLSILMTKDELMTVVRKRNDSTLNGIEDEDQETSAINGSNSTRGNSADRRHTFYLCLLEIQVLLRIEMYCILYPDGQTTTGKNQNEAFSQNQNEKLELLRSLYGEIITKKSTKCQKKSKKRAKMKKPCLTSKRLASELCSILEMISFVLPSTYSFQDFVQTSIVKSYPSLGIINEVLEHFEIDVEGIDDEESVGESSKELEHESNTELLCIDNDDSVPNSEVPISRWDIIRNNGKHGNRTDEEKVEPIPSQPKQRSPNPSIVFKQRMILPTHSQNPLLANGRGTYIGRQLSNNFYNDMREVSSEAITKAKQLSKERKIKVKDEEKCEDRECASKIHETTEPTPSHKSKHDTSHGCAILATRNVDLNGIKNHPTLRTRMKLALSADRSTKKNSTQKRSGERSFHGAAIVAARASLAILRKKTKKY